MARLVIKLGDNDPTTLAKIRENIYSIFANNVEVEFSQQALDNLVRTWKRIKEENATQIGVIACNIEDFCDFMKIIIQKSDIEPKKPLNPRKVVLDNVTYHCIIKAVDMCSYSYDDVLETSFARENKEYDKIKEILPLQMNAKR